MTPDRTLDVPTRPATGGRVAAAVLILTIAALLVGAAPAAAHGDEGVMEITRLEQLGNDQIDLEVGIVYDNDGHQAEDANVSATFSGPDGASVGPVLLDQVRPGASLYSTTVQVPTGGTWTVLVDSTGPSASAAGELAVDTDTLITATTQAPEPTEETTDDTTDDGVEAGADVTADAATAADDAEDAGSATTLIAIAAAVLMVGVGAVLILRRRSATEDAS